MSHEEWQSEDKAWSEINWEWAHTSGIFPADTNLTCTFAAGGSTDTFGAWAEIEDNTSGTTLKLTAQAASANLHLSALFIESTDTVDKMYMIEIGYGSTPTVIYRMRFGSGSKAVAVMQQGRMRSDHIPTGETIKYRMKCETASAEATVSLRFHLHS